MKRGILHKAMIGHVCFVFIYDHLCYGICIGVAGVHQRMGRKNMKSRAIAVIPKFLVARLRKKLLWSRSRVARLPGELRSDSRGHV